MSEPTGERVRPTDARGAWMWSVCGALVDAVTVAVSVADIVTDVLVLLDFARLGFRGFFFASAAIFALAQASYAFLFVATYAGHRSAKARVVVFLAVLPFSQLVPLFAWLEAFHFTSLDLRLLALGLRPTGAAAEPAAAKGGDTLWGFLQSKYQSHAGFLVEAFVEAVPQAVLQSVFVVVARQGSALSVTSVSISIFTVASKGYLVSYALDYLTFFFNFSCIVADCLGLFAIVTHLALHGVQGHLAAALCSAAALGLVLSVIGGHSVLWFTITDDHLKLLWPKRWPDGVRGVSSIFFDLYVVRYSAWLLAIVPCVVLFAGARLSLLPVVVLKSIDPDLVRHARFFRGLMRFLEGSGGGSPDRTMRLLTANTFISKCRRDVVRLQWALRTTPKGVEAATVARWASSVGTIVPRPGSVQPSQASAEDIALQKAILDSLRTAPMDGHADGDGAAQHTAAAAAVAALRRLRAVAWLRRQFRQGYAVLQLRSELFSADSASRAAEERSRMNPDVALRFLAMGSLSVVAICAVPLAVSHAGVVALSIVLPVAKIAPACAAVLSSAPESCSANSAIAGSSTEATLGIASLPCGLALAYCGVLLSALAMAPAVARRQVVWLDLADLRDFPEPFYGGAVLVEIRKRHLRDSMLRRRLGHYLTEHVVSFLEL